MRLLAIGDIHGCDTAFRTLWDCVQPAPEDEIVFLGDYVDRGPNTKDVIQWILDHEASHRLMCLRGNHEVMMLGSRSDSLTYHHWNSFGGYETLISYGCEYTQAWAERIPANHWDFLERTERWYQKEGYIFVHAAVLHDRAMEDQTDRTLFWERCFTMQPHGSGKKVICGHTPQASLKPEVYNFGVCIDTGVYAGGWLTCLDVHSGQYWQSNEAGESRQDALA